jgi:hypothetical protein
MINRKGGITVAKYIVGQTYKAVFSDETKHCFEVIEQGHDVYSDVFRIRWEDNYEETAHKADLDSWVDKAEEEEQSDPAKLDNDTAEDIESLKALRDLHLHNAKVLEHAIAKLEKRP